MIDFHSHILPNIDDGASSIEESIQLLNMLKEQGVTDVVLTSHYYPTQQSVEDFLIRRQEAYNSIKDLIPQGISVHLASEIYFDENVKDFWRIEDLAIVNTEYLLIELPHTVRWSAKLLPTIEDLIDTTAYTPILVHIEKYKPIRCNPSLVRDLIDMGCLIQCNARSFLHKNTASLTKTLLKRKQVHCFGTDTHNTTVRPPKYAQARDFIIKNIGQTYWDYMQDNMRAILQNQDLEIPLTPPVVGLFGKLYF